MGRFAISFRVPRNKISIIWPLLAFFPALVFNQTKTVMDDAGNIFPLAAPPQRIVSLAPNITEILFALGLGESVIGVTRYCDYPPAALQKEKVGGLTDPNIEKIKSLNPDLVIAFRGNPWNIITRLQAFRLRVFVLDIGNSLDSVPRTIEKIGQITRRENEAQALLKSLEDKYQQVLTVLAPLVRKPKVFFNLHGMDLSTCGQGSYLDDLLERAKSVNIAGHIPRQWLVYSREQLIKDNPDVIIIQAKSEADFRKAKDWYKTNAGFQTLQAVKTDRIHFIDENISSRFGPRLYDAFAELARLIHPELFSGGGIK